MNEIRELRAELDAADAELMRLFEKRMELSSAIGAAKRASGIAITDAKREEVVVASRTLALPEEFRGGGERLVRLLIEESKRVQRRGLNLYLIGMPDCGKTRTGRKLSALLKMPLADTDRMITEKTGRSIEELFAAAGEEGFRALEAAALRAVAERGSLIVAAGGGLPLWGDNAKVMRGSGITVFLDRKLEALHGQSTAGRPLIAADTLEQVNANIDRLYFERHEKYLACADMTLDPDSGSAAERIAEAYSKLIDQ